MNKKIVITGAAGLVGQNLISLLEREDFAEIIAVDKHERNVEVLRQLHPDIRILLEDLRTSNAWQRELEDCTHLVISHAQINGLREEDFVQNNVFASERLIEAALRYRVPYIVNISSSVLNTKAVDWYTNSKKAQERLIVDSGIKQIVLRPTLMFGWFDRKALTWLGHYMQRVRLFPIPGHGRYLRQPLYAADFASVIVSALKTEKTGAFNITGQEPVNYIDLVRIIKETLGARARIQEFPYWVFWLCLKVNAIFSSTPVFTTSQLEALVASDVAEVIDWPGIFDVRATPLREALEATFNHPVYSKIALDF